ncbi:MAG: glucose-1-phosphate adenylyltransferase [Alphaproteobacteria bacterium CG_4_10_14_0_2_um_filter_63_37]|nr:MAG: glucose-1-phosphate adenylyltransferase [Proteobacteria bacterium CG1_02_64_396]PJA25857.1 MAG: glucose-1-phosphate adenylyltransferase [Alphaproteobacteria bacterium CG_4_10_14_0_2_um_filter_63_37]
MSQSVTQSTRDTLTILLAGGRGSRLDPLTRWRAKPAVHFGGKYRIIDFALSNVVNSGLRRIAVVTQYMSHSLQRHLQRGWNFFSPELGDFLEIWSAQQRAGMERWYEGTADALYHNLDIIREIRPRYVLLLAADHIYKMDYSLMVEAHIASGAQVTVGAIEVSKEEGKAFGVMHVDASQRILDFVEKPADPPTVPGRPDICLASMGIYVFNADYLLDALERDAVLIGSDHDFGKNVIPEAVQAGHAAAFPFVDRNKGEQAYWRDVGTIDAYFEANMDLISVSPQLNLYDATWPLYTLQIQSPPAKFVFADEDRAGTALDSIVSGGNIISGGRVERSVLAPNVRVNSFSLVEDSILFPEVDVGRHAKVRRAIVEKRIQIPAEVEIGYDLELERKRGFTVSAGGIVVVDPETIARPGFEW